MDAQYELQGQTFEWDLEKAAANVLKHHVAFEKACEVFFDPFLILVDAGDDDEPREAAIGLTEDWSARRGPRHPPGRCPPDHLGSPGHTLGEEGV